MNFDLTLDARAAILSTFLSEFSRLIFFARDCRRASCPLSAVILIFLGSVEGCFRWKNASSVPRLGFKPALLSSGLLTTEFVTWSPTDISSDIFRANESTQESRGKKNAYFRGFGTVRCQALSLGCRGTSGSVSRSRPVTFRYHLLTVNDLKIAWRLEFQ